MKEKPIPTSYPTRSNPTILPGSVGGIAVDTNIYRSTGFRFRSYPLARLTDIKPWQIVLLVPEVWERELERHTTVWAEERLNEYRRLDYVDDWGTPAQVKAAKELLKSLAGEEKARVAGQLIDEHYDAAEAVKLKTAWSAGPKVLDDYFAARFPFEPTGNKKSEFPDALALVTLEDWGRRNKRQVVVVSDDAGCLAACDESKHLLGFKNLTDAYKALGDANTVNAQSSEDIERALAQELKSDVSPLRKDLDAHIERAVEKIHIELNVMGVDHHDVSVDEVSLFAVFADPVDVKILRTGLHDIEFVWLLQVELAITASYVGRRSPGPRLQVSSYAAPVTRTDTVDLEVVVTARTHSKMSAAEVANATVKHLEPTRRAIEIDWEEVVVWTIRYDL
jgi:hypothetical protein